MSLRARSREWAGVRRERVRLRRRAKRVRGAEVAAVVRVATGPPQRIVAGLRGLAARGSGGRGRDQAEANCGSAGTEVSIASHSPRPTPRSFRCPSCSPRLAPTHPPRGHFAGARGDRGVTRRRGLGVGSPDPPQRSGGAERTRCPRVGGCSGGGAESEARSPQRAGGGAERTRTSDTRFRKPLLYPN
jgi:hypothetical protein